MHGRLLLSVALVTTSIVPTDAARAAVDQKKVLVVYSTRRDTQAAIVGDREMPRLLERALGSKPDFYSEYIDAARFPEPDYAVAFRDYLRLKYAGSRLDVVVAMHDLALEFVASAREELFAGTPVVFLANNRSARRLANSAGIFMDRDYRGTLELALALQPDTTQVFVVIGNSNHDDQLEQEARAQFESFAPKLSFTYLSNLTTHELEQRVADLPEHSIIYYLLFYQDAAGVNVNPVEYLDRLAPIANRPIYSWVDSTMSRGVVGGRLVRIESEIGVLAALAVRVLQGERADTIPISPADLAVNEVDWRQLQRWQISEMRVPAGTFIRFREANLWQRYQAYILGAAALLVAQSAMIAGLLVQRARRRRAEEQARASQAALRASYGRIRALGRRLIDAQDAERSRLARELHDDIHQQMAVLAIDLDLLGLRLDRGDEARRLARESCERAHAIAKSVRDISHQLHPARLRLVGLVPALRSLLRELPHPDINVTFTDENVPESIPQDLTLCLYRIAQEALQNAIKYSASHEITVRLSGTPDGLTLTIADNGTGFDVDAARDRGLGLTSMVERLEPFGGTLTVRSTPGTGTHVEARVSLAATRSEKIDAGVR